MSLVEKPWSVPVEEILEDNNIDVEQGLNPDTVTKRQEKYGKNKLQEKEKKSALSILLDQIKSIIMILLGIAALVSFLFGESVQGLAIVAVIIVTIMIGFFTEIRAVRSMESLKKMSRVTAVVRRNGEITKLSATELVPGDIVLLESGDVVTADIRLIEANKLQLDESVLTGESVPVSKSTEPVSEDSSVDKKTNMLFKGTLVTRGSGAGIVISTGKQTELGKISSLVEEAEEEITPLEKRLKVLGRKLIWVTLIISAVVGLLGILRGKDLFLMIETAIALAVAAIPEGLPIVATIALAQGMLRMAKRNALINRLSSVETLGSTNVIFTDKTGTLTLNKMTVNSIELPEGRINVSNDLENEKTFTLKKESIDPQEHKSLFEALRIGTLCNNASLQSDDENDGGVGDPLEIALLGVAQKADLTREDLIDKMPEEHEEAFDPEIKMMATVHRKNDSFYVAVKGAPEEVINHSTSILTNDEQSNFNEKLQNQWIEKNEQMAEEGLRVLALAMKTSESKEEDIYKDLVFIGLVGLLDPPRKDVKKYINTCQRAGINIVMVTGDHPATARNVAKAISLIEQEDNEVILGETLKPYDQLSDDEREHILSNSIFARVSPKQKLDLISIHQHHDAIVAMTGDGVNDAPALKKADIGIAMGKKGTQVAQDASDMILQDDSFSSIVAAIEYGRNIFSNIRKFIIFLLSGNIGEIAAVAFASLANLPLPITPLQILYVNLMLDVFPALALGIGEGTSDVMEKPPRDPKESFLMRNHWLMILGYGFIIAFSIIASLLIALLGLNMPIEKAVTISFLTLTFARLAHVFNMREKDSPVINNEVTRNPFIWGAIGLCTVLILAAVYVPVLSGVLQTVDPGLNGWLIISIMSLIPFIFGQLSLLIAYKKEKQR